MICHDFGKEIMSEELWFGKYQKLRLLGKGASSNVYLAMHTTLHQYRAIKCISKAHISYDQLRQEIYLLIQLKSSFIPVIYDVEEDDMYLYIIEEYVEGESLLSYRKRVKQVPENIIIDLALQICEYIHYMHSMKHPVLYLDLKPSNLLIHNGHLRLVDFGAARFKYDVSGKKNYGTPVFAAPEQYYHSTLNESTDIYGIGMLLYFLMTGSLHITNRDLPSIMKLKGYSKALLRLVSRSIKHNPCERYTSVMSFKRKLLQLKKRLADKKNVANTSKTIALIGSQHRIGVTHLAFLILGTLKMSGKNVLYVECNASTVLDCIVSHTKQYSDTVVVYEGCTLTKAEWKHEEHRTSYDYIIYDYGCISDHSYEQFLMADIQIAVMGWKMWEKVESKHLMKTLNGISTVKYAINMLGARDFYAIARNIKGLHVFRIPYEPNPWSNHNKELSEFVQLLID